MKRFLPCDDRGSALLIVMGVGMAMLAFAIVASTTSVVGLRDSQNHVTFAQNLDTAEAGIDQVSARLQKTNGTYSYCPTSVNVPSCDVPATVQTNGFSSEAAERTWAKDTLTKLAADNQSLLKPAPGGQYLAIRPPSLNTIYSMSWVPSYTKATRQRLIKSEYIFSTYHPANAILTNGDIDCCSSYNVGYAPGTPAGTTLGIHTNGSLNGVPSACSGCGTVTVSASATGTCSGCTSNAPTEKVPDINPRDVYNSESSKYPGNWYDLCPDGKVYAPNTSSTGVPCTGTLISATLPYRGWSKSGSNWSNSGGNYPGVYYVYKANIDLNNVDLTGAMTMITESTYNHVPAKCTNPRDGWIEHKKVTWTAGGFISGLMVLSGDHFKSFTQSNEGTGGFLAQSYVEQQTSSAPGIYGFMIAENYCPGETNRLQGQVLFYDGGDDIPIGSKIRSTLELELL
jgi:hypothetical protein